MQPWAPAGIAKEANASLEYKRDSKLEKMQNEFAHYKSDVFLRKILARILASTSKFVILSRGFNEHRI